MKTYTLTFCLLWLGFNLQAQSHFQKGPYLSVSYFGMLGTHPGLSIGLDYPVIILNKVDQDVKRDELLAGAHLYFYFHRRNQIGLGGTFQFSFRNRKNKGLNKEVALGLGYLCTFLPNKIYQFNGSEPGKRSTGQLLKMISLGGGRSLGSSIGSDFWMIKPTLMHIKPFGIGSTLNFAMDAGVNFQ